MLHRAGQHGADQHGTGQHGTAGPDGAARSATAGPGGGGALFSGDIVQVVADRRWVSFMRSFPNLIPERPRVIRRGLSLLEPYPFERVYGSFWGRVVEADGAAAVRRSAERYLRYALDDGS